MQSENTFPIIITGLYCYLLIVFFLTKSTIETESNAFRFLYKLEMIFKFSCCRKIKVLSY